MIDQDIALQLDRALDGEDGISLNGSQSLLSTADTVQMLYDQQHAVPSAEFVSRLERTLFAAPAPVIPTTTPLTPTTIPVTPTTTPVIPTEVEGPPPIVIPTGAEGPPAAAAVSQKTTPFPPRSSATRSRLPRRWFAIAAVLALILGGGGALVVGPFDLHSTPEPSAIPAFGFGTVEASPNSANEANLGWVVSSSGGEHAESEDTSPVVDNRTIFRSFYTATAAYHTQAVDMTTGDVLWDVPLDVCGEVMASSGDLLLVGGRVGALLKDFSLVALDRTTGEEVWRTALTEQPMAIAVDGDRAFVLGSENHLDAIDLAAGDSIYMSDIGGESRAVDPLLLRSPNNRIAIAGDTLVAALADGTLAGVDLDTGAGLWWNLRQDDGSVQIGFVDGALLVIDHDEGSYPRQETSNESSESATPVAEASPVAAECFGSPNASTPVVTTETDAELIHGPTYLRLDPKTGKTLWAIETPAPLPGEYMTDMGIVYLVSTARDIPADRSQLSFCAIDSSTGRSSVIDPMTDLGGSPFVLNIAGQPDRAYVAVDLDGDDLISAPALFDPTVTGPKITIDFDANGGTRWLGIYDDAIYLSRLDGSLEKIPIPVQ